MNISDGPGGAHDTAQNTSSPADFDKILEALRLIHSPSSSNETRRSASFFLEAVKSSNEAPYQGFQLLTNRGIPSTARYFGASLLEHSTRHKWTENPEQVNTLIKEWVIFLAKNLNEQDPSFLSSKIAELWVDVAKRSWGLEWSEMDDALVNLWNQSVAQKVFVLTVLETLSESVFGHEDPAAGIRGTDLNKACVEIFTSEQTLNECFPSRETTSKLRCGTQGWLARASEILEECVNVGSTSDAQALILKTLILLRAVVLWMVPQAIISCEIVRRLLQCITIPSLPVQTATIDALHILYSRSTFASNDLNDLLQPLLQGESINLLKDLYQWSVADASDIDAERYAINKKMSETLFNIGGLLLGYEALLRENIDLTGFFDLLYSTLSSPSLQVSIPSLHLWVRILASVAYRQLRPVINLTEQLLEVCSSRLIRYESFPEDTDNQTIMFLNADFDTLPEKHAFLGNYHRFCHNLIELIVENHAQAALPHLLQRASMQLDQFLSKQTPYMLDQGYNKSSIPLLQLDAEFSAIEAALRGYMRTIQNESNQEDIEQYISELGGWCRRLINAEFKDPLAHERAIQLLLAFGAGPLKKDSSFAIATFYYIIRTQYQIKPGCVALNSAVEELDSFCQHQIQRLAMRFPDFLASDFQNIEKEIASILQNQQLDDQLRMRYSAVLFILTHRAHQEDPDTAELQLQNFLQPLILQWQNQELDQALSNFQSFCGMLGVSGVQQYFLQRNAHQIEDWTSSVLDKEGEAFQDRMQQALAKAPLRSTKTMLSVSIEKLETGSPQYEMACRLWRSNIPAILPNLLKFISQAQAFHNAENWDLPADMKLLVRKILTDRFWQVGISNESRDDFYAKVDSSKKTLEGLASSIRSTIRSVREAGYRVVFYLSRLGEHFYGYQELPQPLSEALFTNSGALSLHQMAMLIDMVKAIIENCPPSCRAHFLPPVSRACFEQLDRRLSHEWVKVEHRQNANLNEDGLSQEMKDESILRQLMFASVGMLSGLVGPPKPSLMKSAPAAALASTNELESAQSTRSFSLQTPEVLQPILVFCNHALRMRDTRSCQSIANILVSLIPEFLDSSPVHVDVREYLASEVLKSCITSIHDSYFVDVQRELAMVVASIVQQYSSTTETIQAVLLTLPGMTVEKVLNLFRQLHRTRTNHKQQRAVVLVFLDNLRGVSVSEQGRVGKPDPKKIRSAAQERHMIMEIKPKEERQPSPELEGVATMFG